MKMAQLRPGVQLKDKIEVRLKPQEEKQYQRYKDNTKRVALSNKLNEATNNE